MRSIKEYLYFAIKRQSYRAHESYFRNYYSKQFEIFENCTEKKDKRTIKREMKALKKYWRCYPYQLYTLLVLPLRL